MGTIKKVQAGKQVTLTLDAKDAQTLLTALTHAVHGGGLKTELRKNKEERLS
jgi:phosphotransferase system HPr-like phosphotransfer protein